MMQHRIILNYNQYVPLVGGYQELETVSANSQKSQQRRGVGIANHITCFRSQHRYRSRIFRSALIVEG